MSQGWVRTEFEPNPSGFTALESVLTRGDVVAFVRFIGKKKTSFGWIHGHTCLDGVLMYGANNEARSASTTNFLPTWKWATCTSRQYAETVQRFAGNRVDKLWHYKKP